MATISYQQAVSKVKGLIAGKSKFKIGKTGEKPSDRFSG